MFMLLPYFAHIVPTGLRTLIDWINLLKLTIMVTKYLHTLPDRLVGDSRLVAIRNENLINNEVIQSIKTLVGLAHF